LAREWERFDPFRGLPQTAQLSCASVLRICQTEREKPSAPGPSLGQAVEELVNSPNRAWAAATWGWREARYRNFGSYEDEVAAMTFYHDRKRDLQGATNANSWAE